MSEKKVVKRSIAITLGIICIILVVGLVGAIAFYMPVINEKNSTISSLNSQITDANKEISQLNEPHLYTTILNWTNTTWVDTQPPFELHGYADVDGVVFNAGNITAHSVSIHFQLLITSNLVNGNVQNDVYSVEDVGAKSFVTFHNRIQYWGANIIEVTGYAEYS